MGLFNLIKRFFKGIFVKEQPKAISSLHIEKRQILVGPEIVKPEVPKQRKILDFPGVKHIQKQEGVVKEIDVFYEAIDGVEFVFDKGGYKIYNSWWKEDDDVKVYVKDNYLMGKEGNKIQSFHRFLLDKEVESYSEDYNYNISDVHVHHRNFDRHDNRESNLEILYKDEHANRHGYDTWEEYQQHRDS